jgi:hypothetical protein
MGLTSWKNSPHGAVRKADVSIAKNYLSKEELDSLNLIISAYLDFAELQARGHKPMHMRDWIAKLDSFLRLSDREILLGAGKISHALAEEHTYAQFAIFDEQRRLEADANDFDRTVEEVKKLSATSPKRLRKGDAQ